MLASDNPRLVTEWHWRLAKPISIAILILFALSFSSTDVRNRRVSNLLFAFLIYFAYTNAMGVAVALMKKGDVDPRFGLWTVHAVFGFAAVWVFLCRSQGKRLLQLPTLRRRKVA